MSEKKKHIVDRCRLLFEIREMITKTKFKWEIKRAFKEVGLSKYFADCWDMSFYYSYINIMPFREVIQLILVLMIYRNILLYDGLGFSHKQLKESGFDYWTADGCFNILKAEFER